MATIHTFAVAPLNGQMTAYIDVKGEGVKSVRVGDRVLEFRMEAVDPGLVTLSLDGVETRLSY